ncbi:MAG: Rpn family recombination-promoting nuclease/putative transposase [Roseburia sp.]|nr:Rpn family recombination-promoting nuclease/putative transposase [Roseburia sp.]
MGQKDLSVKELTSYPDVVADLINVFVYGGKEVVHSEELRPYNTGESVVDTQGILKGLFRDNCMENLRDGTRYMLVGIENQDDVDYTMPVRVMGYDYAGYVRQLEELAAENKRAGKDMGARRIQKGQKIKPVVTFVLYYGGREDMPVELLQMLDVSEDVGLQKYIKNYEINLICLRDMTLSQVQSFRSDFAFVAKYLSRSYNKKQLSDELQKEEIFLTHMKATLYTLAAVSGIKGI